MKSRINKKSIYFAPWNNTNWWLEEALLKQVQPHQYNRDSIERAFKMLQQVYTHKWIKKNLKHPIAITLKALAVNRDWIYGDSTGILPPGWVELDPFHPIQEWIKNHSEEQTLPFFSHAKGINLFILMIRHGNDIANTLEDIIHIPNCNDVIAQLMSGDATIIQHAKSIINVGKLFLTKEFEIDFEPSIKGTMKRPDMRIKKNTYTCFLEIKKLSEPEHTIIYEYIYSHLYEKINKENSWTNESQRSLSIRFKQELVNKIKIKQNDTDTIINKIVEEICSTISRLHNNTEFTGIEDIPSIAQIEIKPSNSGQIEYSGPSYSFEEESDRIMRNAFYEALKQLSHNEMGLVWIEHKLFPNLELIESKFKFIFNENKFPNIIGAVFVTSVIVMSAGMGGTSPVTFLIPNPYCRYDPKLSSLGEFLKDIGDALPFYRAL